MRSVSSLLLAFALCACAARHTTNTVVAVAPPAFDATPDVIITDASEQLATDAAVEAAPVPDVSAPEPVRSALERMQAATPDGMNLVLITIDTLRWDLHYAGNPRELSPRMDALAAQSVNFSRGYALSSYTGRSLGPMLIGRYPTECPNDNQHFTGYYLRNLFLSERLQRAGFYTMGASAHSYLGANRALTQGMNHWDHSAHPPDDTDLHIVDHQIADAVLTQLRRRPRDRRFFLWVHFVDPHTEYMPHPGITPFGRRVRDQYDTEVFSTDREVGRILDALNEHHLRERTVVVLSADHGELFNEHGMSRHGRELWENLVRVPLLFSVPGIAPRRVDTPRSHIDVVPTLLELLRVPAPPTGELHGQSLVGDLLGDSVPERPVFMDLPQGPANEPRRALSFQGWKVLLRREQELLYHLEEDPGELHDVHTQQAERQREMMRLLREHTQSFTGRWAVEQPR